MDKDAEKNKSALHWWITLGSRNRSMMVLDLMFFFFASWVGFALRLSVFMTSFYDDMVLSGVIFSLVTVGCFFAGGVYRIYWPQASLEEFAVLSRWYLLSALAFVLIRLFAPFVFVPRTSLVITLFSGFFLCAVYRASWRFFMSMGHRKKSMVRSLIVGAGDAGTTLARDLIRNGEELLPIGFIDDDRDKKGKKIAGLPVIGPLSELEKIVEREKASLVLVAMPSASRKSLGAILRRLAAMGVETRVLPSLRDIAGGTVATTMLRNVKLEDLLARDPVALDAKGIGDLVRNRVILITGAGGSIGSELTRQLASYGPSRLVLLGHGEHSIYTLCEEFREKSLAVPYEAVIRDVADRDGMEEVFGKFKPSLVFHAGAHKHVPLMEYNPKEALRVNGLGTWVLADLCGTWGVERMVMVSTDKAVKPSSVMGATKRVAEMVVQDAQARYPNTKYMAVRFGNVLGSRGSVIPKFERQIEQGGPLTVTHPGMKRYFMLIPEAAGLILQAGALGQGGEIFVLDMGEPVSIVEMAETLIKLHGYRPGVDIAVEFTGVRSGEKLMEELFYDPASVSATSHGKIFRSCLEAAPSEFPIKDMIESAMAVKDCEILGAIKKIVPEFTHPGA